MSAFTTLAGVGPKLARRIERVLNIWTLNDLELATRDGRLSRVPGMGPRRMRMITDALAARHVVAAKLPAAPVVDAPSVAELLDIDREYRERALARDLPLVRGRPVLYAERQTRHYTVAYPNAERMWVWIRRDNDAGPAQWLVYSRGGRRMVRGRESECAFYYEASELRQLA